MTQTFEYILILQSIFVFIFFKEIKDLPLTLIVFCIQNLNNYASSYLKCKIWCHYNSLHTELWLVFLSYIYLPYSCCEDSKKMCGYQWQTESVKETCLKTVSILVISSKLIKVLGCCSWYDGDVMSNGSWPCPPGASVSNMQDFCQT